MSASAEDWLTPIRARANAATPGPWTSQEYTDAKDDEGCAILAGERGTMGERVFAYAIEYPWTTPESCTADAAFIAGTREDVPRLLDEIDRLRATIQRVRDVHRDGGESQGFTPEVDGGYGYIPHCCTACGSFGEFSVAWPCATIAALDGQVAP